MSVRVRVRVRAWFSFFCACVFRCVCVPMQSLHSCALAYAQREWRRSGVVCV